jgi:L-amino acid N-acyltransferase YncA
VSHLTPAGGAAGGTSGYTANPATTATTGTRSPVTGAPIRLHDGRRVDVRPIRPSDTDGLLKLYARLSPETRRSRFFTAGSTKRRADAVRLTALDGRYDCVLVATEVEQGKTRIAAVEQLAGYGANVETALVVRDDYQGAGPGGALFRQLLGVGARRGIRNVQASVLRSNPRILRILHHHHAQLQAAESGVLQATIHCAA